MNTYFPEVKNIQYEGRESSNPLAFKWYDKDRVVLGKSMGDHLRFGVAYWHTLKNQGADPFGESTMDRRWNHYHEPLDRARATCDAAFEFISKLGVDYYCFHDRDLAPEGSSFAESCANLEAMVTHAKQLQQTSRNQTTLGNSEFVLSPPIRARSRDKSRLSCVRLRGSPGEAGARRHPGAGGENYVFWGGREGYETLLNTRMKQEQEQMAAFFRMCVEYARKIGFSGQFLIEPKPKEPTKHQYDFDSATILNFLQTYELIDYFKLNIEANHATLAGHTFEHELAVAAAAGKLGSMDVNRGDPLLGWDTDQFPTDLYSAIYAMLELLGAGGLGSGGMNFDAKVRRGSFEPVDLFHAHIGGMDAFARGLVIASAIIEDGFLEDFKKQRYSSWEGAGAAALAGRSSLENCESFIREHGEPQVPSGRQEYLENLINSFI